MSPLSLALKPRRPALLRGQAQTLDLLIALQAPDMVKALNALTLDPLGTTPEEFEAIYQADRQKFKKVIADAKIPLQD